MKTGLSSGVFSSKESKLPFFWKAKVQIPGKGTYQLITEGPQRKERIPPAPSLSLPRQNWRRGLPFKTALNSPERGRKVKLSAGAAEEIGHSQNSERDLTL